MKLFAAKNFNMREFERVSAESPDALNQYIKDAGLQYIDEGTARVAYVLSSRFVLKVAKGEEKGVAQNRAEYFSYINAKPALKEILPRVHRMEPQGLWLISDLVRPLRSDREFGELSGGLSWKEMEDYATTQMKPKLKKGQHTTEALRILRGLRELHLISRPVYETFARDQWGRSAEGKLVLLDSGGSQDVLDTYYGADGTWG